MIVFKNFNRFLVAGLLLAGQIFSVQAYDVEKVNAEIARCKQNAADDVLKSTLEQVNKFKLLGANNIQPNNLLRFINCGLTQQNVNEILTNNFSKEELENIISMDLDVNELSSLPNIKLLPNLKSFGLSNNSNLKLTSNDLNLLKLSKISLIAIVETQQEAYMNSIPSLIINQNNLSPDEKKELNQTCDLLIHFDLVNPDGYRTLICNFDTTKKTIFLNIEEDLLFMKKESNEKQREINKKIIDDRFADLQRNFEQSKEESNTLRSLINIQQEEIKKLLDVISEQGLQ